MTDEGSPKVARIAARATLFALRASLADPGRVARHLILALPQMQPLGLGAAAEWLAQLPKPLSCIGMEARGRMAVGGWTISRSGKAWPEFEDMLNAVFDESVSARRGRVQTEVVVRGPDGDAFELTFDQCKQWLSDYEFPLADFNIASATDTEPEGGAMCVITFSHPAGGTLEFE